MPERVVAFGDRLRLHFRLVAAGREADSTFDGEPIELTLGNGELADNLERWLVGLKPGERHVFLLEPWQAFGEWDAANVQTIPLSDFSEGSLAPGTLMAFQLPSGETLPGAVQSVDDAAATVDFNHPLCGCPIEFEVEVVEILDSP